MKRLLITLAFILAFPIAFAGLRSAPGPLQVRVFACEPTVSGNFCIQQHQPKSNGPPSRGTSGFAQSGRGDLPPGSGFEAALFALALMIFISRR